MLFDFIRRYFDKRKRFAAALKRSNEALLRGDWRAAAHANIDAISIKWGVEDKPDTTDQEKK